MKSGNRRVASRKDKQSVKETICYIDQILNAVHGTPDLGNVSDPLEELIFLTITQRTHIGTAVSIFRNLRNRFPDLKDMLNAEDSELANILSIGGRGNLRLRAIRELLSSVLQEEGRLSLECLKAKSEEEVLQYLTSLPWVGEKIARCVMLYSLGFNTFPADSNAIRILRRTRVLESLIGSLDGIEHRKVQTLIVEYIPAKIARTLHINMVIHGQEICRERNPKCVICQIKKFCGYWRKQQVSEPGKLPLAMVDLFCGIGGISLGFHNEGFQILLAIDNDPSTVQIFKLNHPWINDSRILCKDVRYLDRRKIRQIIGNQKVDVLVAGVPCQGYSKVGYRTKPELAECLKYKPENDPRNFLFKQVIRIANIISPNFILLENVPDMNSANVTHYGGDARVIELLERRLGKLGYRTTTVLLDASDFGVPQNRKRLFFVASKNNLPDDLETQLRNLADMMYPEANVKLSGVLTDLPPVDPSGGDFVVPINHGQTSGLLYNHMARFHNDDDLMIICDLRQGESYTTLAARKPEVLEGRTHKTYSTDNFHDKFYRLKSDAPCRTIVAHLAKDGNSFIHPEQDRSLTVREAAGIQGFPEDFFFTESRSTQFTGIGNAVPPPLASVFARFFKQMLDVK